MSDSGVFKISEDQALVQSVDVLTPIADDPWTFGAIVAANALSDIYVMGGKPCTALTILEYLPEKVSNKTVSKILEGARDKLSEANCSIIGGHTIKSDELRFGIAVTGIINPKDIISNQGAKVGDCLILTKPLGTGVLSTALKKDCISKETLNAAYKSMLALNKEPSRIMRRFGIKGAVDITGFGLLIHCLFFAKASKVGFRISADRVPLLEGAYELAKKGVFPGGSLANYEFVKPFIKFSKRVKEPLRRLLCDAQTSGGILMAVPSRNSKIKDKVLSALKRKGIKPAVIGEVINKKTIIVK